MPHIVLMWNIRFLIPPPSPLPALFFVKGEKLEQDDELSDALDPDPVGLGVQ